jgi:hypothetical protein
MNERRGKHSLFKKKMDILAHMYAKKEIHVVLAARLRITLSTLNATVENRKDTRKWYTQCGRFSDQRKSLKQAPFQ